MGGRDQMGMRTQVLVGLVSDCRTTGVRLAMVPSLGPKFLLLYPVMSMAPLPLLWIAHRCLSDPLFGANLSGVPSVPSEN